MIFKNAVVTGNKFDLAKAEITITLKMHVSNDALQEAKELTNYMGKEPTPVDIEIVPHQFPLFNSVVAKKAEEAMAKAVIPAEVSIVREELINGELAEEAMIQEEEDETEP